jgi:hypothetical protein
MTDVEKALWESHLSLLAEMRDELRLIRMNSKNIRGKNARSEAYTRWLALALRGGEQSLTTGRERRIEMEADWEAYQEERKAQRVSASISTDLAEAPPAG